MKKWIFSLMCVLSISIYTLNSTNLSESGFIENKGQIADQNKNPRNDVLFMYHNQNMKVYLKNNSFSYELYSVDTSLKSVSSHRIDVDLVGCNENPEIISENKSTDYNNYYLSYLCNKTVVAYKYGKITYKNIYPYIDLVFYAKSQNGQKTVKYDFIIKPGGNISDIKLSYKGATGLFLDRAGKINIITTQGNITENIPLCYEKSSDKNRQIDARYRLDGNIISFYLKKYDTAKELVIDPVVRSWGTYYADVEDDNGWDVFVDNAQNVIVVGATGSSVNIATSGTYQQTFGGAIYDAFVVKFNSAGVRQWGTYYGGAGDELGLRLDVDDSGNIYFTGYTNSDDNIALSGYQMAHGGGNDAFIAKLSSSGNLLWGTYYGGADDDFGQTVSVNSNGDVFVTGYTSTATGLATMGAYQTSNNGLADAFIVKFNTSGARQWATYYGGPSNDATYGIDLSDNGDIYVCGKTTSSSDIATPGAHQDVFSGSFDVFLLKLNSSGTPLWCTYYGGTGSDIGNGLAVDTWNNVYITGSTMSTTGISTPGCYQSVFGGGGMASDIFLAKFNSAGVMQWGTYYGSNDSDTGLDIDIKGSDNVFVFGYARSTNIATANAYQSTHGGGIADSFIAKFKADGTISWGTYYGGSGSDSWGGIGVNVNNDYEYFAITGVTGSTDNIASAGAHQENYIGGVGLRDAYAALFYDCYLKAISDTTIPGSFACENDSITFITQVQGTPAISYQWFFDGNIIVGAVDSFYTVCPVSLSTQGNYKCAVSNACETDTVDFAILGVFPSPDVDLGPDTSITQGDSIMFDAGAGFISYLWDNGNTGQSILVKNSGTYWVEVNDGSCSGYDTIILTITPVIIIDIGNDTSICQGDSVIFDPGAGYNTYMWQDGSTDQTYTADTSGLYWVEVSDTAMNTARDSVILTVNPLPFVDLGPDTASCGLSYLLNAGTGFSGYYWQDGSTQDVFSATSTGSYWVEVSDSNGCLASDTVDLTLLHIPVVDLGDDTAICEDTFSVLDAGSEFVSYLWQDGNTNQVYTATTTGLYSVEATDSSGCKGNDTIQLTVNLLPSVYLGPDTSVCKISYILDAGSGYATYLWQNGDTEQTFTVSSDGIYWIKVTDNNGCSGTDSAGIIINPPPDVDLGSDQTLCDNKITLSPDSGFASYQWQDGSTGKTYEITTGGIYWVEVADTSNCSDIDSVEIYQCPSVIWVPNAITPDGDGHNDYFEIFSIGITYFEMYIFDRWGQIIFETKDINDKWKGNNNDINCILGVYSWMIYYEIFEDPGNRHIKQGSVTLLK